MIHVLAWVVVDDPQNARQVHVLQCLSRPDIHELTPFIKGIVFALVRVDEEVVLLLDRLDFSDLLKLSEQVKENLLIEEQSKIESGALGAHVKRLTTLEGRNVHWERVIDEDLLDSRILTDNPLNVEEIVLIFFVKILWVLGVILIIFIFFIWLLLLETLCVGEVKFDLVFGDLRSFPENHAPNAFINIQVLAKILGNMPLKDKLVVLLTEILNHELVAATMDLRELCNFLSF